jgi:hypothetical protein
LPRLLREAKALARLNHPNVVTVHDVGETDDGQFFIAMELVEGVTLGRWLARRDRSWQDVLDVYLEAGRGLAAAHDAGVVHRDFKPSNVLVADEGRRVLVTDFGLARVTANGADESATFPARTRDALSDPAITRAGALIGSPAYMSPEQLAGRPADVRSDVFSFCVSLWAGLYGTRPFGGGTVDELRRAIAAQSPSALIRANAVPAPIRDALSKGLREAPDERPQHVHALLAELGRQLAREGLARAERILREAEALFPPSEKARAVPAVAVSLLEREIGERLRPQPSAAGDGASELASVEVSGRPMQRFMELVGPYEWIMSHFVARAGLPTGDDGIARFDPDAWYPYSLALDFACSEPFGPEVAHHIGHTFARAVLQTQGVPAGAPFTVASLLRVDDAFNRCLRLRGVTLDRLRAQQGADDRGFVDYVAHEPSAIEVKTKGFARCATSRGYWTAVAEHFGRGVEVVHRAGPCRDEGADVCRYLLVTRG